MTYTFDELRRVLFPNLYQVYDIFISHFGEEKTDLQGVPDNRELENHAKIEDSNAVVSPFEVNVSDEALERISRYYEREDQLYPFILVYWPVVTITNENNRSTIIRDLYAKIAVTIDGYIPSDSEGFLLNRASYSYLHFINGYMHSHISDIPCGNFTQFKSPCLGTGPIRNTIRSLKNENDGVTWMLFCQELGMYVTVESLRGGPYHRMENLRDDMNTCPWEDRYRFNAGSNFSSLINRLGLDKFQAFIEYYIKNNNLSFNYINKQFVINLPFYDYMLDVSNAFIKFCNDNISSEDTINNLFDYRILRELKTANGKFYVGRHGYVNDRDVARYQGQKVCTFKGEEIKVSIEPRTSSSDEMSNCILLEFSYAMNILRLILRIINYYYGNTEFQPGSRSENSSTTAHKTNIYL